MAYKDKLPILKNFVEMGITQDVSSVDTTIYVSNASLFPAVVPGADYIPCVIRWSGSTREIVHVVAVNTSANTITVERGKEGTAAQSWPSGSFLYATLTAQAQTDILNNIWIRCRASNGDAVAVTVESATSFSLPGDWRDSLEPMMALRILANGSFLSTENGIYIDSVAYTASTGKTLVSIRGTSLPAKVAAIEHSLSSRAISQSKEVQEYRNLVERVSANLNASEKICIENADRAQAAAAKLTFSSAINSTKEDCAATPLAVKKAYDRGSAGVTAAGNALDVANSKVSRAGDMMEGRLGGLRGIPQADATNRYAYGALEIRENGAVGNTQSDVAYAPTIGFHWANNNAGTLVFRNDGIFAFLKRNGTRAVVDCDVPYATLAGTAQRLRNAQGNEMTFSWQGQGGQPAWVWGADEPGTDVKVWNPTNFLVNKARNMSGTLVYSGYMDPRYHLDLDEFYPTGQNRLGRANNKWGQIYSSNTTISTSDRRQKDFIEEIPEEILNIWDSIPFRQFKFKDAIVQKTSEGARLHTGFIAQEVETVFSENGFDASRYGLFCFDKWESQEETLEECDAQGNIIKIAKPRVEAGESYALRYEEALCMEAACARRRTRMLETRVQTLEKEIAQLKSALLNLRS